MLLSLSSTFTVFTGVAIAFVSLTTLSACGTSQDAIEGSAERVESQLTSLDAAVDLSDVQMVRIRKILTAQEANRPSGPPPRGGGRQSGGVDPRAQRETQRAAADAQIEAELTDTQIEAFRAWRASQPPPREGGPPRGR